MPLPALLGLPALGVYLLSIISALVAFFASYLTKKLAIRVLGVGVIVGLTATFIAAMQTAITAIEYAVPNTINIAASWVLPTNFGLCFSTIIGVMVTRWLYDWQVKFVQMKVS